MNRLFRYALDWQIRKAREQSDKFVSQILHLSEGETPPEAGLRPEVLRWSGRPGFVATFNSREFVSACIITAICTLMATILFANDDFPIEATAVLASITVGLGLLLVGWVRQVCRYVKTLGMYYAVTDSRLVIIKWQRIVAEKPLESVISVSTDSKGFFGNGSIVFNEGEDYLKHNLLEAPTRKVFAFFNVLDPYNAVSAVTRGNGQSRP